MEELPILYHTAQLLDAIAMHDDMGASIHIKQLKRLAREQVSGYEIFIGFIRDEYKKRRLEYENEADTNKATS